jgi:hypothetical protein
MSVDAINIYNNIELNINKDLCSICLEPLNENIHKMNCNHDFHASCLISWLTSGNSNTCPLCRTSENTNKNFYNYSNDNEKVKFIIKYSKNNKVNKNVKKLVNNFEKLKVKNNNFLKHSREYRKKYKNFIKKNEYQKYNVKLRRQEWKLKRKLRIAKSDLINIPIMPMLINK